MQTFKTYLQEKGYSPVTVKEYQRQTGLFSVWYGRGEMINCQKKDILGYLSYLKNKKKMQVISRNNALIALRHYFDYLLALSQIANNPTSLIKLRGMVKRKLSYIYNTEEMDELADVYFQLEVRKAEEALTLEYPRNTARNSYLARMRNYVMLLFLIHQGLTTRELLELQIDDIQLHKATVHIPKGTRRGNARTLPLHATQMGALLIYLQTIRPQLANPDSGTLFLSVKQGNEATMTAATALVRLSCQLKRINSNFYSLAQLRASVITHWIKSHGLRKAQYFAGHKSIVSTEEYLPNYIEDLADDMTKFNPF